MGEPPTAPESDPAAADGVTSDRGWRRLRARVRRLPRSVLLVLLALLLLPLWLSLPTSRPVQIVVRDPASLTRLDLAWLEAPSLTPLRRSTYHFAPGEAPARLTTELRAARGSYVLQIATERGAERQQVEREVQVGTMASTIQIAVP